MVRRVRSYPLILAVSATVVALSLTGCDSAREAFGFNKNSPDEFAVVTRAPLTIPPDYGLRPPRPGAERPQEKPVRDAAKGTLMATGGGNQTPPAAQAPAPPQVALSKGERALLSAADALKADPDIRQKIDRESHLLAEADRSFVDRLIFWQKPQPPGSAVDPAKESQRIRENQALGEPATKGETPVIKRRERGWLEGILPDSIF